MYVTSSNWESQSSLSLRICYIQKCSSIRRSVIDMVAQNRATIENIRSKLDRREDREILDWITTVNFVSQKRDYFQRRQPGTGEWFLKSPEFREWRKGKRKTLFCTGAPGAGKTIVTSIAIDSFLRTAVADESIGIAYI